MQRIFRRTLMLSLIFTLVQFQFLFLYPPTIQAAVVTTGLSMDKTQAVAGYSSPITINATTSGATSFEAGIPPVVAILLNDSPVTSISVTQPTSAATTSSATSFKIGTGLVAGSYQFRFLKSNNTTYYANFSVVTPTISLSTNSIPNTYSSSIAITVTGTNTSFSAGQTTVSVLTNGNSNTNKAGTATINSTTSLSFSLATGLAAGEDYIVKVVTGSETVTANLTVRNPSVAISPTSAASGYNQPISITANGTNTKFTENTPTVSILSGSTVMATPTATVSNNTSLTFSMPTGLAAGPYTVKVSTGQEIVTSTFTVNTATVALTDGGQTLTSIAEGYSARTITVAGTNTNFSSGSTVNLAKGASDFSNKISAVTANSTTNLTFSLGTGLTSGTYTVTIVTNGVSSTYNFSVIVPSITFSGVTSPFSKDFANKTFTLTGISTSFTQNVTTVSIKRNSNNAEIASATSAVNVTSATSLTFALNTGTVGLTADTYRICSTTNGTETCASNTFTLTSASATINPSTITADISAGKTITVTGNSTNFADGSTTGQLLDGGTPVTGVTVSAAAVSSAGSLTVTLTKSAALTAKTYTLRMTTNSTSVNNEVVDASLIVSDTGFNLNTTSNVKEGYTSAIYNVSGINTNYDANTIVQYKANADAAYETIPSANVTVNGAVSMTVALPAGLKGTSYTLKIGSDTASFTIIPIISITVTPDGTSTIAKNGIVQLTATAAYSDSSSVDATNLVNWSSTLGSIASVSSAGLVTGLADGSTSINATWFEVQGSKQIVVDDTPPSINNIPATGGNAVSFTPTTTETGITATLKKGTAAAASYTLGTIIGVEGSYVLEATDSVGNKTTISFIVANSNLNISGVANTLVYNTSVSPTITGGTAALSKDGGAAAAYTSGTQIIASGSYVLTVTDTFGNFRTVSFTVNDTLPPVVIGIADGGLYNAAVTPTFTEGTATLSINGGIEGAYSSGTAISADGTYKLTVTDAAGNHAIISFTITPIQISNEGSTTANGPIFIPISDSTTPPKLELPVIKDDAPITELQGTTVVNNSGVAVMTLDTTKALESIKSSKEDDFKLVVDGNVKKVEVSVSTDIFEEMAKKGDTASLTIVSKQAEFNIPVKALDLAAIRSQLGVSSGEKLDIQISIKEPEVAVQTEIQQKVNGSGGKIIIAPIDFAIQVQSNGKSISVNNFDNVYVTRSFEVNKDQVNAELATGVVYLPETKQYRSVPTKFSIGMDGKVRIDLLRNGNSIYMVLETKVSFLDVGNKHWAKNNIDLMASKLILSGVGENKFNPEGQITRAQFAAIVVRALGLLPEKPSGQFKDIDTSAWYAGEIEAAFKAHIVAGRSKDKFDPNAPVSRQDMALMISNAMKYAGKSSPLSKLQENAALSKFKDGLTIASYAQSAVAFAINQNIVKGMTETTFEGTGLATRAQASTMVLQMLRALDFSN